MYLQQRKLSTCLVNTMSMQDPPSVVGDSLDERCKPKSLRVNPTNFSLSRLDTSEFKSSVSMMGISLQPLYRFNVCS
jgi:hypothetical protein